MDGIGIRLPTICIRPGLPNKAASGFFSNILREPLAGKEAVLPVSEDVRHWHASPRSAVGFLLHAATMDSATAGARRNLTMPGLSATVGEEIAALKRVAGDKVAARIKREPDPFIMGIVAGWPRNFDASRARQLGFTTAEQTFDDIIRIHIDDELSGKFGDSEMFISFTSFLYPSSVFRYDFGSHELSPLREAEFRFDPADYETKQVFFHSKDGTSVPMFVNYRKGLELNSQNPTILYGYGGFNVSLTPAFSPTQIAWMERGGVYAVACLRGGSEYGEEWHRAGMLENKQNVFDDFSAAAEWLIANGYTSTPKLSIMGGSNGGLLVAACMVQRPELYGAVICRVPVIDMLRYHKFTVGRYWVGEYGNAEANPEHFKFMYAYSPLHNVRADVNYPPTLIMTADTDDRVVPAHAMKFAATLQEYYTGPNPIITRVEMKAGHGAGKPTSKLIEETVDIYAFLLQVFC
jgi:prolyl oligopeptidase PreP (S9A serine peptidase family)